MPKKPKTPHVEPLKAKLIDAEITDFVRDLIAQQQPVKTDWVVHGLMQQHQGLEGEDAPFYLTCAYGFVRTRVRGVLRKLGLVVELDDDTQPALPGWQHLQQAYVVERDQASHIVPIEQMSFEEIMAKADEYRVMGQGCFSHADELVRYGKSLSAVA